MRSGAGTIDGDAVVPVDLAGGRRGGALRHRAEPGERRRDAGGGAAAVAGARIRRTTVQGLDLARGW